MKIENEIDKLKIEITSQAEMISLGKKLGKLIKPNIVFALIGDLGAGKTTLTKGIGAALCVSETINSPTFTIMKTYQTKNELVPILYHLDVYRISGSKTDFDLEEYFYMGGCSVVEWADQIEDLLPNDAIWIKILNSGENQRTLTIQSIAQDLIDKIKRLLQVVNADD